MVWYSERELPQWVILDIKNWTKLNYKKFIEYLGIRNWSKVSSNAKWVELLISYGSENMLRW